MVDRITVVVADDEAVARRRLARLLEETGDASVLAACSGGRETIERVKSLVPQVLFLDVQMPDLDGFEVLAARPAALRPEIVFVTAYDRYALRAFDVRALDYLLKPFDQARFREAFDRVRERVQRPRRATDDGDMRAALLELASRLDRESRFLDRIAIKADEALKVIRTTDIDWFEAHGNYVRIHLGAIQHRIRGTISNLEERLDPQRFIRTHRRSIVNLDRIVEVQPWFTGHAIVVLRGGAKVALSRSYRGRLTERLGKRPASVG